MRLVGAAGMVALAAVITSCGGGAGREKAPSIPWSTGFWFWQGSSAAVSAGAAPVDVLYCQIGNIWHNPRPSPYRKEWGVHLELPEKLPPAKEYWLVLRSDVPLPGTGTAAIVVEKANEALAEARKRGLPVAGIQLDIDAPTSQLAQYAAFLREVRKSLPKDVQLSITGLLDWFRKGTAIGEVVAAVDEFVPQFYDVDNRGDHAAIAARIDATKWAPVFNAFRKRFRIGISTFGRSRMVAPDGLRSAGRYSGVGGLIIGGVKPLDLGVNPAFTLSTSRTTAGEVVLSYRAITSTRFGYSTVDEGDSIEFTLATPESVRTAVEQVRQMKGFCAGVLFFRWPSYQETLAMPPDEVLQLAHGGAPPPGKAVELSAVDGKCAAVHCVDLVLLNAGPLRAEPIRYRIRSSADLEYFLPGERVPIRMTAPAELTLALPPYGGRTRMALGRAVTAKDAKYEIEVIR